ncbi:hypothetical protein [Lacipirellula parvula]|uniref:Uncharacterized protein n=1 Tax=Lacipirellula parvula TaxID=2650471 RepID=A0A5K7X813_9BACT|nr:hypothetical protein [Lacipirellula parvula]BBO32525.1 hypothetical protein PLANPX_2137 [Lacipirellula parvula]
MRFRKFRIAWSIAFAILTLAIVAGCLTLQYRGGRSSLWQRGGPGPTDIGVSDGKIWLSWQPRVAYRPQWAGQISRRGFRYNMYSNGSWNISGPTLVIGAALATAPSLVAALPWLQYRFSLRAILIATAMLGALLALAVTP